MTRRYRTHEDASIEHFRNHPEEIGEYLAIAFDESKEDGDWRAFLIALRIAVETKSSMAEVAENLGRSRPSLYKTLSENGNPRLETVEAILREVGFELTVRPTATS